MKRVVLDASAVVTFFENRPGADKVEELVNAAIQGKKELLMSVVNWGEVYYTTWRAHGRDAAEKLLAEIAQLPIEIVDADTEVTRLAAEFRAQHKLHYTDCFAAALTQQRKAVLATADRDFGQIQSRLQILWTVGP